MGGVDHQTAYERAAAYAVRIGGGTDTDAQVIVNAANHIDPRYSGLWVERAVYPLIAAPFVFAIGVDGMLITALLGGVVLAVALGWLVLRLSGSAVGAVLGAALLFALPSGLIIASLYAEGWMLVFVVAALALASEYVTTGNRQALVAFVPTMIVLVLTKSAYELVVTAAVFGTMATVLILRGGVWRRAAALSVVGVGIGGAATVAFARLGLPGLAESTQYLFTHGYRLPDVPSPLTRLIRLDIRSLPGWVLGVLKLPSWMLFGAAGGHLALLLTRHLWFLPWLIAGPASVLVYLLHPVSSEANRYIIGIWLCAAFGLAMAAAWLEEAVCRPERRRPELPEGAGEPERAALPFTPVSEEVGLEENA